MLSLYPHNQQMLDQVNDILTTHNRACIEMATGCGKSFVVYAYHEQHPHDRMLIITPHAYIATDQMRKIASIEPTYDFSNVASMTYAKLLKLYQDNAIAPDTYDCIVFDELHHIGAAQWGRAARMLIELNPDATILGTTATPIRADGKDMAAALFTPEERCIPYTLVEALYDGVLNTPTYIVGTYELASRVQKIGRTIQTCTNDELKALLEKDYNYLQTTIAQSAVNVDELIYEHLTAFIPHPKIIVFCPTVTQMMHAANNVHTWFREKPTDMHIWTVSCKNSAAINEMHLLEFNNDTDDTVTRVMFAVDCIGEGVHISGVDAVVMMRPTSSTNVYLQQMGRCLESGAKRTPVIFDLVDNLAGIESPAIIRQQVRKSVLALVNSGEWAARIKAGLNDGKTDTQIVNEIINDVLNNFGTEPSATIGAIMNAAITQARTDQLRYGKALTSVIIDTDQIDLEFDDDLDIDFDDGTISIDGIEIDDMLDDTDCIVLEDDDELDLDQTTPVAVTPHKPARPYNTTSPQDVTRIRKCDNPSAPDRLFTIIDHTVSIRELLDRLEYTLEKNQRAQEIIIELCADYISRIRTGKAVEPIADWLDEAYAYCLAHDVDPLDDEIA